MPVQVDRVLGPLTGQGTPQMRVCLDNGCFAEESPWSDVPAPRLVAGNRFIQLSAKSADEGRRGTMVTLGQGMELVPWSVTTGVKVVWVGMDTTLDDGPNQEFPGVPLGVPAQGRVVVIAAHFSTNSPPSIMSLNVDGDEAVKVVSVGEGNGAGSPGALFVYASPSRAQAEVEIKTVGGPALRCGISVWALYGLQSMVAADTAVYEGMDPGAVTLDIPLGGVALAGATLHQSMGAAVAWSGAVPTYEFIMPEGTHTLMSGARRFGTTAMTNHLVGADGSGAAMTMRMFAASFQ